MHSRPVVLAISFIAQITLANGQNPLCYSSSVLNLDDDLPFFQARFPDVSFKTPTRNPYLGGRNGTYCCIRAVNDYVRNNCTNTSQVHISPRILDPDMQFPCGAMYIGNVSGAPEVTATYNWTKYNCPGWQLSQASNVNEWAQLLVAFILPCVVFSFNIPRPRKLKLWEKLFPEDIGSFSKAIAGLFGAIGAAICVSVDTIIWLCFSFAFAGPLLLSGLYEAQLDNRVLAYLQGHIEHNKLPLGLRARILFTILCGNLDMYPAWSDTMDLAKHLDNLDRQSPDFRRQPAQTLDRFTAFTEADGPSTAALRPRTASHSRSLSRSRSPSDYGDLGQSSRSVYRDSADDARDTTPLQPNTDDASRGLANNLSPDQGQRDGMSSLHMTATLNSLATAQAESVDQDNLSDADRAYKRFKTIKKVTVRLRSMLACQLSFGTTIGGPVVFFLGSFIYALLEIRQDIGDENIAEALAFGMWWIILPHIAAVAGLLLAGNNPNILEGIVSIRDLRYAVGESLVDRRIERRTTVASEAPILSSFLAPKKPGRGSLLERVYEADYAPAWMWDRGKCKQDWLLVLFTDSWLKYQRDDKLPPSIRKGLEDFLIDAVMLRTRDWILMGSYAILLIFIPCLFAFLTAYYTPEIGVGCRSGTILIYMGSQTLLLILWSYYLTLRDNYWATAQKVKRMLLRPPTSKSEDDLETLILELKDQAVRDTTIPNSWTRRFGDRGASVSDGASLNPLQARDKAHPIIKILFYVLVSFAFTLGLMTSIGGTLMQIIGVYRSNICLMGAPNWTHSRRHTTYLTLSTNTAEAIREARKDWIILGAFSVVFLGVVCYLGWWYQKRLRRTFKSIAGKLDGQHQKDVELI